MQDLMTIRAAMRARQWAAAELRELRAMTAGLPEQIRTGTARAFRLDFPA